VVESSQKAAKELKAALLRSASAAADAAVMVNI
jgi:hypothetical protein